jgi:putative nucleotidyltransferase with HDIG domain
MGRDTTNLLRVAPEPRQFVQRSPSAHILVVDDEPWIADVVAEQLRLRGFLADTTTDSSQVMSRLATVPYALVVLDISMPPPDGLELLESIRRRYPHLPVLMLTACDDTETAIQAMQEGASDYIVKPHQPAQLLLRVERAIERGQLMRERAQAVQMLEQRVHQQTQQLHQQSQQLTTMIEHVLLTYQATLTALEAALDARDQSAPGHCRRVAELAVQLGRQMGLGKDDLSALEHGARLHDIGKLGIPDTILLKPGPLSPDERRVMERHPEIGCEIVAHIDFLSDALPIIHHHHEHWDGTGYPDGLKRTEIPLLARIFSVVDAFDAQANVRPYNTRPSVRKALASVRAHRGTWFDPSAVDVFVSMMTERERTQAPGAVPTLHVIQDLSDPNH